MPAENVFSVPSFVDVLSMKVNLEMTDIQSINFCVNKLDQVTDTIDDHFKNRTFFNYDDDSIVSIGKQADGWVRAHPLHTIPMVSPHAGAT